MGPRLPCDVIGELVEDCGDFAGSEGGVDFLTLSNVILHRTFSYAVSRGTDLWVRYCLITLMLRHDPLPAAS